MKAIVIGQVGNGKSTFAKKLGDILSIPVFHLDLYMDNVVGRDDKGKTDKIMVREYIEGIVKREDWIIDGNAFTKDKELRIKEAQIIYVFNFGVTRSFLAYLLRYARVVFFEHKQIGRTYKKLNLGYYVPYIFWKFPKRLSEAIALAKSLDKEVIFIQNTKEAEEYIRKIIT